MSRIKIFLPLGILLVATLSGHAQDQPAKSQVERNRLLNQVFNEGLKAQEAKDWQTALERYRQASTIDPGQHVVWAHLGDCALALAKQTKDTAQRSLLLNEALLAYQRAVEMKPAEASYRNNYSLALAESGNFADAQTQLKAAIAADPAHAAQYQYNLGATAANTNHMPEACAAFRAALQADPSYSAAQQQFDRFFCATPPLGPSAAAKLEDMMQFLENNLSSRVNYTSKENNATVSSRFEVSAVRADAAQCRIDWHILQSKNGVTQQNSDASVLLSQVGRVERLMYSGNEPNLFSVRLEMGSSRFEFIFLDKAVADRVGGMFLNAVDRCRARQ